MNSVEQLLSDTADYFEEHLKPPTTTELNALINNGQKPFIVRQLNEYNGGVSIQMTVMKTSDLT